MVPACRPGPESRITAHTTNAMKPMKNSIGSNQPSSSCQPD
jgi:hypothetical protein